MSLTYKEIKEKLIDLPEIDLLELLEISSEDLVNRFPDKLENKYDIIVNDLEDFHE